MIQETPAYQTADYMELLLRHLVRDPVVYARAQQFSLVGEDFMLSDEYGSQIYKVLVDCIMMAGKAPVSFELLGMLLRTKLEACAIPDAQHESVFELLSFMYSGELNTVYFCDTLKDFIRHRRQVKARTEAGEDLTLLHSRLDEIGVQLDCSDGLTGAVSVNPFKTLLLPKTREMTLTGFTELDTATDGHGPGEFALVIGYSGGGKTAMGCNIVQYNAVTGVPATYVSMEADEQEIANRFYSNYFGIPYKVLRNGTGKAQLAEAFNKAADSEQAQIDRDNLANNLHLEGLKGLAPLTCNQIHERLLRHYEESGHIPKVLVIDQLQFLSPNKPKKNADGWEVELAVAADADELSHRSVGGVMPAVWLQHQAKGKLKRTFSREDIQGFKGVIQKADLVIGIGRESQRSNTFTMFSIKVRHTADFELDYTGELEYMRFVSQVNQALAMKGYTAQAGPVDPNSLRRDANAPAEEEPTYNGPKE
jgi:hypothetical protein